MGEIIHIYLGEPGLKIGSELLHLYCLEHNLSIEGHTQEELQGSVQKPFYEASEHWTPRSLFIDSDKTSCDELQNSELRNLIHPNDIISHNQDGCSNFAFTKYTLGKEIHNKVEESFLRQLEKCDKLDSIMIHSSLSGGMGSGYLSLLVESLKEYTKAGIISNCIYPSESLSDNVLEIYNTVLSLESIRQFSNLVVIMQNEALYSLNNKLSIEVPDFENINRIIAEIASNLTASSRFGNCEIRDVFTNLVSDRMKNFAIPSLAPFSPQEKLLYDPPSTQQLAHYIFSREYAAASFSTSLRNPVSYAIFRGDNSIPETVRAVNSACINSKTYIKNVFEKPFSTVETGYSKVERGACLFSSHSGIHEIFSSILAKFDRLFVRRVFQYKFISEGMETHEFEERRLDLQNILASYETLIN